MQKKMHEQAGSRDIVEANSRANYKTNRQTDMTVLSALNSALGAGLTRSGAVTGFLSALLLLRAGAVQGQTDSDFALFEPVDSTSNAASSAPRRRGARAAADTAASEAEFSLIGTARIGSRTSVMLRHVSGEEVRVSLERSRMPIPGYEQYAVLGSEGDSVSIQYPQSVACAEFAAQGVSCDASRNIATLSLTTAKAIVPSPAAAETAEPDSGQEEGRDAPINPFEALRSRAQNGAPPPERPDRFQPRRIDPADVPPGMRVVSTPFGDRLVEE